MSVTTTHGGLSIVSPDRIPSPFTTFAVGGGGADGVPSLKPMGGWVREELGEGNALGTHEELARHGKSAGECGDARQPGVADAALDLDGCEGIAGAEDEIHLAVAIEPVLNLDVGAEGTVEKMGADGGLDQTAPMVACGLYAREGCVGERGHEGGVAPVNA